MRKLGIALALTLGVAGCADLSTSLPKLNLGPGSATRNSDDGFVVITVTPRNAARLSPKPVYAGTPTRLPQINSWHYRLGPGDQLAVEIAGHPELSVAASDGQAVAANGSFNVPGLGVIDAGGRSLADLKTELGSRLARKGIRGQLSLSITTFRSQSVTVTGAVHTPGRETLTDQPLTLLQAIGAAGGMTARADAAAITVRRHGRKYPVDLKGFLDANQVRNNPILIDGDVVDVPQKTPVGAYLMGQVRRPGTVSLTNGSVTLTAALNGRGGLSVPRKDARGIFVFRHDPAAPRAPVAVYQFDARSPLAYVAGASFYLLPDDVVYVTASPFSRWKSEISALLPKVGAKTKKTGG